MNTLARLTFDKNNTVLKVNFKEYIINSIPGTELFYKDIIKTIHSVKHNILGIKIKGDILISRKIAAMLWLEEDIEPFITSDNVMENTFYEEIIPLKNQYSKEVIIKEEIASLRDYKKSDPKNFAELKNLAKKYENRKIVFVSSTPRGGGVALMRHALIRLYKLLGVDAHWHVFMSNGEIFKFTKTMHNILQNQIGYFDMKDFKNNIEKYRSWNKDNYHILKNYLKNASIIVIDDPQPSDIISRIKKDFKDVPVIFRWHIQLAKDLITKKGSPQSEVYQFVAKNSKKADMFVFHPVDDFIPEKFEKNKMVKMGAATDPLDGLNKPLSDKQIKLWIKRFNEYAETNIKDKEYIIQTARFDPSKGIPDVIKSYSILVARMKKEKLKIPQLVLVGHGAIDDPDGERVLKETRKLIKTKYKYLQNDIITAKLPHKIKIDSKHWVSTDQILNALLSRSRVALQLSHKEGFEVKVTESLFHGKPVIAYETGGIPLQIEHNKTGFLVPTGDVEKVAEHLYELFTDEKLYKKMSKNAKKYCPNNFTVQNGLSWIKVFNQFV